MRRFFLIHISDLHITGATEDATVLRALTTSVNRELEKLRLQSGANVYVFITGDLVASPTPAALAAAKKFVTSLKEELPITHEPLIVPGNHDVKHVGGSFFKDKSKAFFETFPTSAGVWHMGFESDGLEVVGVDSNGGASFAKGRLDSNSYNELVVAANNLANQVRKHGSQPNSEGTANLRVLALHHHPLPLADGEGFKEIGFIPDEGFMYLQSPATFLNAAMSLGCHLVLHGHRHVSGLVRYSVPTRTSYPRDHLSEEEAWSTMYVLSCPSSTGAGRTDAGFNILEFSEHPGPSSFTPELGIHRFTRPKNAGAFEPVDSRGSRNHLRLQLGKSLERDIALTHYMSVKSQPDGVARNDLLADASTLFNRRAFVLHEVESDWAEALYVFTITAITWAQITARLKGSTDIDAASVVGRELHELQNIAASALKLDGTTFDSLRKLAFDRTAFDKQVPRRNPPNNEEELLARKSAATLRLRNGLENLGIAHWG